MPKPVSASGPQDPGIGSGPTLDETKQAADSAAPSGSEPTSSQAPAVSKLVSALPSPPVALPPAFADYGLTCGARDALFTGVVSAGTGVAVFKPNTAANDDDSVRGNANPFAPYVDAAMELMSGPNTLSVGFSPDVASGGSISIRDVDHDGKPELCVKASSAPVTVGFCIEP